MTNPAHNLLDQLMNEVKKNLVDHQIEKMKTEILNVVDKKQENFLQDMVQICDSIYRETVDASMHAAAQMIQNEKQEMLDLRSCRMLKKKATYMPNYCFRTTFIATLLFESILVH